MKANAPERIWIDNLDEGFWFDSPSGNKSIEYIRKDAFIKKACKFLKDKGSAYISIIDGQLILRKGIIKDFRKYMEGE